MKTKATWILARIAVIVALLLSMASTAMASPGNAVSRYIVVTEPGFAPGEVARGQGLAPAHVYEHALKGFTASLAPGQLERLRADPGVAWVEPDRRVYAVEQTLPTGVDRIEVDQNTTAKIDGVDERIDVDVAIIDTGIDVDHEDLDVVGGRRFYTINTGPPWERGGQGEDDNYDDDNGHGSHVAGITAALDNGVGVVGVAPGARLWAVKVLDQDGGGYLSDVVAGIDWVTENAGTIEVANMSLSWQGNSAAARTAIQNSVGVGVVYVVAAGNDGRDVYGVDGDYGTGDEWEPASYPEVATISAMADADGKPGGTGGDTSFGGDDSFASFSNYSGSVVGDNPVTSPGAAIDLLLPGVDIYSAYKGGAYATMSGTSMASPHGAGLAALYIAANGRAADAAGVYAVRQALIDAGVTQDSSDGLAVQNDPDGNEEYIGWASTGVGSPPTISWNNPTDGAEVAGSVTIQIDATDSEDGAGTLTVQWQVDGGTTWHETTYNSETSYYEASWDSTTVSDGGHTLKAQATDNDGNTTNASVVITTDNVDESPTVSWVNPQDGDTVGGTVAIQISASDDRDSDSDLAVKWCVDGGTWQAASYDSSSGLYEATWDSTTVSDGSHTLTARGTDSASNISAETAIGISVNNDTGGGTMHISAIDMHYTTAGPNYFVHTTVTIMDDGGSPVADATVDLNTTLPDESTTSDSAITGSDGTVSFKVKSRQTGTFTSEVTGVAHASLGYDSSADVETTDSVTVP